MSEEAGIPTPFTKFFKEKSGPDSEWVVWNGVEDPMIVADLYAEVHAGRDGVALLDNSGLQKLQVSGPDAGKLLDFLCTRRVSTLQHERVSYIVLSDENGNIRDDGTAFGMADGSYLLATGTNLMEWAQQYSEGFDVELAEVSSDWCMLAVYGEDCYSLLVEAGVEGLDTLKAFQYREVTVNGIDFNVSRTGFSGGLGYELWAKADAGAQVCELVLNTKLGETAQFVGLSSLDVLRIEAGYIVPGVDFQLPTVGDASPDQYRTPFDMGLDWLVDLDRDNFVGRDSLAVIKEKGSQYQSYSLVLEDTLDLGVASLYGAAISNTVGESIGYVYAGGYSPSMGKNIGLCLINRGEASIGDSIIVGGDKKAATLDATPLYKSKSRTQTPPQ